MTPEVVQLSKLRVAQTLVLPKQYPSFFSKKDIILSSEMSKSGNDPYIYLLCFW